MGSFGGRINVEGRPYTRLGENTTSPIQDFNPSTAGGGKLPPGRSFGCHNPEPHGTIRNALGIFPKYGWATKWHNYYIYIINQKSKMAAAIGGYFLKNLKNNNSDCMQDSCLIPTVLSIFSWSRNFMKLFTILCGSSGSQKSKMVAHKPEILISQLVYNITAEFQRQLPCV